MGREQAVAVREIGKGPLQGRRREELHCKVATKLCLIEHENVLLGLSSSLEYISPPLD